MKKSRLSLVLYALTTKERKHFRKFLTSPFHNQRDEIRELYEILLVEEDTDELAKEHVWQKLNPGTPYKDARMRHIMSELLELVNDFLAWTSITSNPDRKQLEVSREYLSRGLDKQFLVNWNKRGAQKAGRLHQVDNALLDFEWAQLMAGLGPSIGRKQQEDISRHFEGLDEWIALQKLRQAMSFVSHQQLFESGSTSKIRFWEGIQSDITPEWRSQVPLLELFEAAYLLLEQQDERTFFELQQLLETHGPGIHPTELRTLYLIAINYCVKQLNSGKDRYLSILYQIYLNGLEASWLLEKGELSPWTYKNIVSVGLKLKHYDQVETFIESYRKQLPVTYRDDFFQHSRAEVYFARAAYRQVLRTMLHVQIKDPITRLRNRIIRIKACYELGEIGLLESQLDSFIQLLRWEKRSAYHREHYLDFVSNMRQMIRIPPRSSEAINVFRAHLESGKSFIEKAWLMEKVDQLGAQ